MAQVVLNISDNKFKAFLEFIKTLDYVQVEKYSSDVSEYEELKESFSEVKDIQAGKTYKQDAKEFLDEL
jgi:hypothetical protein